MQTDFDPPRIWALLGPRTGDNNQTLALAEAVAIATGARLEEKRLRYTALDRLTNRFLDTGLSSLDAASRQRLAPPWPDLVIGIGRHSVPVARWIRRHSGGRARLVQIGRPRCAPDRIDLVLTTPQYGVPPGPTVLEFPLPPTRLDAAALAAGAAAWEEPLGRFPAPRLALLLGGDSWPWRLTPEDAAAACHTLLARAAAAGGSVLAIGSRRTPEAVLRAVRSALSGGAVPATLLEGLAGNPYAGLLGLADEVTVTADSAAMIADAVATGRPVGLAPVRATGPAGALLAAMRALRRAAAGEPGAGAATRILGRGWGWLVQRGLAGWPRDLWFLWRTCAHQGLGGPADAPVAGGPVPGLAEAVARVRRLLPPAVTEAGPGAAPPGPAHRRGCGGP